MTEKDIKDLKSRNEILDKRCERYRVIMCNEGTSDDKISEYLYSGELSELVSELVIPKLPIGAVSREMWDRKRQKELAGAMSRYLEAGRKIPKELLDEYNEIGDRWEEKK